MNYDILDYLMITSSALHHPPPHLNHVGRRCCSRAAREGCCSPSQAARKEQRAPGQDNGCCKGRGPHRVRVCVVALWSFERVLQSCTGLTAPSTATGGIPPRPANVNPAPPTSLADVNDDPAEVDLAAQNPLSLLAGTGGAGPAGAQNPFAALGGQPGGGGADDMFAQMMQQMMAGAGGAGAGAGAAGAGGAPPGNPFMQPPTSPFPPAPKTFLDRVFPLVHLVAMVGLAVYAVFVYEPAKRMTAYGWNGSDVGIDWKAWSVLLDHRPQETAVLQKIGIHSLAQVVRPQFVLSSDDTRLTSFHAYSLSSGCSSASSSCCRPRASSSFACVTTMGLAYPQTIDLAGISTEPPCTSRHPQFGPPASIAVLAAAGTRHPDRCPLL